MWETWGLTGTRSLFDGRTLSGWHAQPRVYGACWPDGPAVDDMLRDLKIKTPQNPAEHPARWFVEDGAIVGEQSRPGYGGYLVSDEAFGDFCMTVEVRADWPADTGIMVRRRLDDWSGFQVLVDHRESGSIGGFFGNGLASFSAVPFAVRAERDAAGAIIGLGPDDPATSREPVTPAKQRLLSYAASVEDFIAIWRWNDWNEIAIRCVGALPVITTWVNGLRIAEIDTGRIDTEHYDPAAVLTHLGRRGHLAFEVHDNDSMFGDERWGPGARCRWRDVRIKTID